MRKLSPALAHALAAEFVLGTLRGRARQRFEAIVREDASVAAIVRRWEAELTPLAERMAPVEPPARVWKEIESRISSRASSLVPGASFWSSLAFWRGFGAVSAGLATVLLAFFLFLSGAPRDEPLFVAVLTAPDSVPRMVVSMHAPDLLRVRMVKPWKVDNDKGLELWVLPKEGAPRSLGMVANAMGDTMIRIDPSDPRVQGANALAVSLEARSGSPTRQPSGPVLCAGAIAPMRKA